MTSFCCREFSQNSRRAKKAATQSPVFITDRVRPAHVLLTVADYEKLPGKTTSLLDALAQTDGEDFAFTPPHMGAITRAADLD